MPSKRSMEQAMTWLQSKIAERDTLDSINAELCYNVILDLQKKRNEIGALYNNTKKTLDKINLERERAFIEQEEEELHRQEQTKILYQNAIQALSKFSNKDEKKACSP